MYEKIQKNLIRIIELKKMFYINNIPSGYYFTRGSNLLS